MEGKLRDEILESEKARMDLMKWKVALVAGLGAAAGLGAQKNGGGGPVTSPWFLALVPLVCLYVDCLCIHNQFRILVIGRFLKRSAKGLAAEYEETCDKRREFFGLESLAAMGSTMLLSILVAYLGYRPDCPDSPLLKSAGVVGFLAAVAIGFWQRGTNAYLTKVEDAEQPRKAPEENELEKATRGTRPVPALTREPKGSWAYELLYRHQVPFFSATIGASLVAVYAPRLLGLHPVRDALLLAPVAFVGIFDVLRLPLLLQGKPARKTHIPRYDRE